MAPAQLSYLGHVLSGNRHGLDINIRGSDANGVGEHQMATHMLAAGAHHTQLKTVAPDKAYEAKYLVVASLEVNVTQPAAQYVNRLIGSSIDRRTANHGAAR